MNNPFYYTSSPEMLENIQVFVQEIISHEEWKGEVENGKMFGILIAEDGAGQRMTLKAYSGQILGRSDWEGFVPPVFDYLQENGYFKRHEAEIVSVNNEINRMESSVMLRDAREALYAVEKQKPAIPPSRKMPDDEEQRERYIRERQHEKGEYRRQKARWNALLEEKRNALQTIQDEISSLKRERKQRSDDLQQWLFRQFMMLNARGESRNLIDIFSSWAEETGSKCLVPPSGSGECCAPKLLQYAFIHHLKPIEIAEFLVREGRVVCRGACQGRCAPILRWMLQGLEVDVNPLETEEERETLAVLYEDERLIIVDKPAGMLSVPGRTGRRSAWDILRMMRPECPDLMMVHRLDMQTSGVLVAAKTMEAYKEMQSLFLNHSKITKTYYALLEGRLSDNIAREGVISLPLSADYVNRPRQKVDYEKGKKAITHYKVIGEYQGHTILRLHPLTGRTHQLRLHCASKEGLGIPILGDDLYGHHSDRLYLHAFSISFNGLNVTSKHCCFLGKV